jgi:hypothetical protein
VATRARAIRQERGGLALLHGERPRRSDEWAQYYRLAPDSATALDQLDAMWDRHEGVSDGAAPWRAVQLVPSPACASRTKPAPDPKR